MVGPHSVYMAAALIDYFKAHAAKFYGGLQKVKSDALHDRIIHWTHKHEKEAIAPRDIVGARILSDAETTRTVLDDMAEQGLGKWNDAESKRWFILTPTQQSATQQIWHEAGQKENTSRWLTELRRMRSKKAKKKVSKQTKKTKKKTMVRSES